jgi:hypothetical protein
MELSVVETTGTKTKDNTGSITANNLLLVVVVHNVVAVTTVLRITTAYTSKHLAPCPIA